MLTSCMFVDSTVANTSLQTSTGAGALVDGVESLEPAEYGARGRHVNVANVE